MLAEPESVGLMKDAVLWCYSVALALGAAALYVTTIGDYGPFGLTDLRTAAILLTVAPIAELLVVHVQVRRSAHSFSLLELPLIVGVLAAHPLIAVLAYTVGGAAILAFHRRQPPIKLAFNVSSFMLTSTVAVAAFAAIPQAGSSTDAVSVVLAFAAVQLASAIGVLTVFGAISLSEGKLAFRDLPTPLAFGVATSAGGASLGVCFVLIAAVSPFGVVFAAAPLVAVFLANRAYESERQRRHGLELIHSTSKELREGTESSDGLFAALGQCMQALPCDYVVMFVPSGSGEVICFRVDDEGQHRTIVAESTARQVFEIATLVPQSRRISLPANEERSSERSREEMDRLRGALDDARLKEAVLAPLISGTDLLGCLLVCSRGGAFRPFQASDVELLQTIGNGIATHTRLVRLAYADPLTSLPNRRHLLQALERCYESEADIRYVLMIVDLDDFKNINDSLGHAIGDAALIAVGERLQRAVPGALVARLGGDEFGVLTPVADLADWEEVAGAMLRALEAPIDTPAGSFHVRVSIGAARSTSAPTPSMLLRNADIALYEAKRLGKGRAQVFSEELHTRVARSFTLTDALRAAVGAGEIDIAVQPIVRLWDGSVVGGEALARWQSVDHGKVSPAEFVPIAEEHGLSEALTLHIVQRAAECIGHLEVAESLTMSVNVSPGDLSDPRVVTALKQAGSGAHPHTLAVEITERLLVQDPTVAQTLDDLRTAGIKVYLDDFGTGYSSLSYLKDLPVDVLKIPREFVQNIDSGSRTNALIDAIVSMGRSLGMDIIAEGVETDAQRDFLLYVGVSLAQGYLFCPPISPADFVENLHSEDSLMAA